MANPQKSTKSLNSWTGEPFTVLIRKISSDPLSKASFFCIFSIRCNSNFFFVWGEKFINHVTVNWMKKGFYAIRVCRRKMYDTLLYISYRIVYIWLSLFEHIFQKFGSGMFVYMCIKKRVPWNHLNHKHIILKIFKSFSLSLSLSNDLCIGQSFLYRYIFDKLNIASVKVGSQLTST